MPSLSKTLAGSILLVATATGFAQNPTVGLVSYWSMNSTNAGVTPDASTLANNFYLSNAPAVISGQRSNAISLDGTSQLLGLIHGPADNDARGLPIYTSPNGYTIMMWVKGAAQTTKYLFTEASASSTVPLFLLQSGQVAASNNKLDAFVRTSGSTVVLNHVTSVKPVFDGTWHHIAWVDNCGNAKLYIDGVQDAANFTYSYSAPSAFSFDTTTVGALVRSSVSGYFNGAVDDVALWDRPLSQEEVQNVMTNGLPETIVVPPLTIWQAPVSSTNALGDRVAFFVGASGHPEGLTYQWYKDGEALADATSAKLVLTNLTTPGTSLYSAVVTSGSTSITNDAYLVVKPDAALDIKALCSSVVSYWPFDTVVDTPVTNTPDIYYNQTPLWLTNSDSASLVSGQVSNALSFGMMANNQLAKRSSGAPIYSTTNYSISFWVNGPSGQLNKQVFAEGGTNSSGANGDYFFLGTENPASGGLLDVKSSGSASLTDKKSTQTVFDSAWHHVVWVDQGGNARLYVDGVVDQTDFTYYRSNLNLTVTSVGALCRVTAVNYFFGSVDELALWDRPLTWTEIQYIYTNGVPAPVARIMPTITQQPIGSTNHLGEHLTLSVVATGSSPMTYQWLKDGVAVSGATDSLLSFSFTTAATNDYCVVITNIAGSVTSSVAQVMVLADAAPNLQAGLNYYWPLDTFVDGTTPDLYSHADMTLVGMDSSYLTPAVFSNGFAFYGSQYGAQSGGIPIYLATNYTVSLWVNGNTGQSDARIFCEGSSTDSSVTSPLFTMGTDKTGASPSLDVYLRANGGTVLMDHRQSSRAVFDGTWHHVLWADENGKVKLYIDGVLDETDFSYTRLPLSVSTTAIGAVLRTTSSYFFSGTIDEVALWTRALSWTEAQQVVAGDIPPSGASIAPVIYVQPTNISHFAFSTAPAVFAVLNSGTAPVSYQWRKDGVNIPVSVNDSANSNVLSVAAADATSGDFDVVITNVAGAVTSQVAQLTVLSSSLQVDFDLTNSPNVQPGFMGMTLAGNGSSLGGIKVTVAALDGTALSDRNRVTSPMVTNNPPTLTQAQIYNDFIFCTNQTAVGTGLSVLLENLTPNTTFGLTAWSYDPVSSGERSSDWAETASGTSIPLVTNYTFNGDILPTADYDYTLGGLVTSTADGKLKIEGAKSSTNVATAVYLNGFRLNPNPIIRVTSTSVVNDKLRLTVETEYPGQIVTFQETTDLTSTWAISTSGTIVAQHGPIITVDFPLSAGRTFYRALWTTP